MGNYLVTDADLAWVADCGRDEGAPVRRECGACIHFVPDAINPEAGLGHCGGLHRGLAEFAGVDRQCSAWRSAMASEVVRTPSLRSV